MYDMSDSMRSHYKGDYYTPKKRELVKKYLAHMRIVEAMKGTSMRGAHELAVHQDGTIETATNLGCMAGTFLSGYFISLLGLFYVVCNGFISAILSLLLVQKARCVTLDTSVVEERAAVLYTRMF